MDSARQNPPKLASRATMALTGIVRLVARQAAREWTERGQQADRPKPRVPSSGKQP